MRFWGLIKKRFFKEKEVGLINLENIVMVPDRSFYKDDIETTNLINKYSEIYLQLLLQKKAITSNELKFDGLHKDMVMNVDLLLHNVITNYFVHLAPEELTIQVSKNNLYLFEIFRIEKKIIARLIALKEIKKSERIPHRNKIHLTNEINSLYISLSTLLHQKVAIQNEINTFVKSMSINNSGIDNKIINQRYNKLVFISSPLNIFDDISKVENEIDRIVLIERILEIYAYKNKDEVSLLESQLEELKGINKSKGNKNELLNSIYSLEQKFLLFYEYGINMISEEQMKNLYKLKFDILTCDIDYLRESPIKPCDYGYEYYKSFVMNKLEQILLQKNIYLNETFKQYTLDAINIIKESLKNVDDEYDFETILANKYMLNLLLSFDKKNGFDELLKNNMLYTNINFNMANFYERDLLKSLHDYWNNNISLKSYLSFIHVSDWELASSKEWNIYRLYKIIERLELESNIYRIPEGIKYLDGNMIPASHLNELRAKSNGKTVVLPSTLKILRNNVLNGEYTEIILNNGLEVIENWSLFKTINSSIVIPSSVETVGECAFNHRKLNTIVFDDFTNSRVLHNKDALIEMLKSFFYVQKTGNKKYHFLSDSVIRKQRDYSNGNYSCFFDADLFDHAGWRYELKKTSRLEEIILRDGNTSVSINKGEFSISYYGELWHDNSDTYEIADYDVYSLVKKLCQVILEKTGHNIFKEEKQKIRVK